MNLALKLALPFASIASLALACGPQEAPPNELAAPAVSALAAASVDGDIAPLLSPDVLVVDGDTRIEGAVDAAAQLAGQGLKLATKVDSHHDVLRAKVTRDGDELIMFGAIDDDGLFKFIVLVAPPADGDATNGSAQISDYQASWNEADVEKRTALLDSSWSEGGRYVDPTVDVTGADALNEHITGFLDSLPGAEIIGASDVVEGGRAVHFRWITKGMSGLVNIEGMDVGLVDENGKLALIAGFFGPFENL